MILTRYAERLAWLVLLPPCVMLSSPSPAFADAPADLAPGTLIGGGGQEANPYAVPIVLVAIFVVSLALMALMRFWRTGRGHGGKDDGTPRNTEGTETAGEAAPPKGTRLSRPVSLVVSSILAIALAGLATLAYVMMDGLSQPTARCVITAMPGIPGSELKPAEPGESSEYRNAIIEANETKEPVRTQDFVFYDYDGPPLRRASGQEGSNIAIADLPDIFPIAVPSQGAQETNFRSSVLYDPAKIDPTFLGRLREEYPEEQYSAESADNIWCELCKERAERAREVMGVLKFAAPAVVAVILAISLCLSVMSRRTERLIEGMGADDSTSA